MKPKIIIRADTDDVDKIAKFQKATREDIFVMPITDGIKVYVIKENGDVTELK